MKEYRVCTQCPKHHIENCDTCFGFGVYQGANGLVPVTAAEAHGPEGTPGATPCPECGSTPVGLPDGVARPDVAMAQAADRAFVEQDYGPWEWEFPSPGLARLMKEESVDAKTQMRIRLVDLHTPFFWFLVFLSRAPLHPWVQAELWPPMKINGERQIWFHVAKREPYPVAAGEIA